MRARERGSDTNQWVSITEDMWRGYSWVTRCQSKAGKQQGPRPKREREKEVSGRSMAVIMQVYEKRRDLVLFNPRLTVVIMQIHAFFLFFFFLKKNSFAHGVSTMSRPCLCHVPIKRKKISRQILSGHTCSCV